jgi:Cu2+-exporting ATPase
VVYDETVIVIKTIRAKVHECGYYCSGEYVPRHLASPGIRPPKGSDDATNGTVIDERRHLS